MTRRVFYWPILIIGVLLIVAPFAISLPSKASAGQAMLDNFHPIMQPASVKQTVSLYENTFLKLKPVASGGIAAAGEETALLKGLATGLHLSPHNSSSTSVDSFPLSLSCWRVSRNWSRSSPRWVPAWRLQAARGHDASQRVELPTGGQPAELSSLHVVLRGSRNLDRRPCLLGLGVGWRQRQVSPSP